MKIRVKITITIALTLFAIIFLTIFVFTQLFIVDNRNSLLLDIAQQNKKLTTFAENNFTDPEEAILFFKETDYLSRIENIIESRIIIADSDLEVLINPMDIENEDFKDLIVSGKQLRRFFTFEDLFMLTSDSNLGKLYFAEINGSNYYISDQEFKVENSTFISIFLKKQTELAIPPVRYLLNIFLIFLLAGLISLIVGLILGRNITEPVMKLSRSVGLISNGDYSENIRIKGYDEISILAKNINIMKSKIQKSHDSLKEFTYMLSHEIKNMITSINGYAVGISEGVYSTEQEINEALNIIKSKTKDLENITESLLMLSKIENRIIEVSRKEIDIKDIADQIIGLYEIDLDKNNLRIKKDYDLPPDLILIHDRYLVQTVISNLINNAIKYSSSDSEILIKISLAGENVIFSVSNLGPEITKDESDKIFNMFYRSKKYEFKNIKGFGLGLAISKKIASILGATLDFASEEKINTFIFKIPKNQPEIS